MKNKAYIGISFIVLLFGIWAIPKIVDRIQNKEIVEGESLDNVGGNRGSNGDLMTIGQVKPFELTNQDGKTISNKDLEGKVYVLEFFFSRCPTICPQMNRNMLKIEQAFFGNPNFAIASITIDPENDTAEVLKAHAAQLGAKSSNWHFLTGKKDYIYDLANKGFNMYAGANSDASGGFEHSGMFALIDKKGNIRCRKDNYGNPIVYYDGLENHGITAIMNDIKLLLRE